ncbi:MAG: Uma2 family endonuclease [Cyanobacteria bacterium J06627_28]
MQTLKKQYTLAEYRTLQEAAEERHEYHDGEVVAMTGGTLEHSAISGNIYALLKSALRHSHFKPFNSDLRVWIPQYNKGVYPGVSVIAEEATFNDDRRDEILNPTLIVEVLSTSTEAYDRGDKFINYRSIPTFSEYLLVSQYQPWVDHYTKSENGDWILRSYDSLKAQLSLMTGGATLSLEDIYEDVISL